MPIEQSFTQLKSILLDTKCVIMSEDPPTHICVSQGSLYGILPNSAQKIVNFNLSCAGSGTKITSSSRIAPNWKNLTLYGNIVAAFVAGLFLWIAADMSHYMETGEPSFWSWLAQVYAYRNLGYAAFMINVNRALALVLVITIVFEIIIVIYVYPRSNIFAQQILDRMPS